MRYERTTEYRQPRDGEWIESYPYAAPIKYKHRDGYTPRAAWIMREVPEPDPGQYTPHNPVAVKTDLPPSPGTVIGAEYVGAKVDCGQPHVVDGYSLGVSGSSGSAPEQEPVYQTAEECAEAITRTWMHYEPRKSYIYRIVCEHLSRYRPDSEAERIAQWMADNRAIVQEHWPSKRLDKPGDEYHVAIGPTPIDAIRAAMKAESKTGEQK